MGSKMFFSTHATILHNNTTNHQSLPSFAFNPKHKKHLKSTLSTNPPAPTTGTTYEVMFKTLKDCKLGISRYPNFDYNAEGGKGTASAIETEDGLKIAVCFDVGSLYIPPLVGATTRFLGLPLPPFLRIDIVPQLLKGVLDRETGRVDLDFKAEFLFSVGEVYKAQPLVVETKLTSEEAQGSIRGGKGQRMNGEGQCRLVGIATVDPINDLFMDSFLALPTECLAVLNAKIILFNP